MNTSVVAESSPADDDDGVALRRLIMARRPGAAQERPSGPSAAGRARLDEGGDGKAAGSPSPFMHVRMSALRPEIAK